MTNEDAARRQADLENDRQAEFSRRRRSNAILTAAALAVMFYAASVEFFRYGVL